MIARVPLFGSMDYSEIAEITKVLYTRTFMPGVPIVRASDAGDAMFIIASGEAVVEISPGQHALLKEGAFSPRWRCSNIGDISMMSSPKCASAFMSSTACRWPG